MSGGENNAWSEMSRKGRVNDWMETLRLTERLAKANGKRRCRNAQHDEDRCWAMRMPVEG